jgi:hypothetical protein
MGDQLPLFEPEKGEFLFSNVEYKRILEENGIQFD